MVKKSLCQADVSNEVVPDIHMVNLMNARLEEIRHFLRLEITDSCVSKTLQQTNY